MSCEEHLVKCLKCVRHGRQFSFELKEYVDILKSPVFFTRFGDLPPRLHGIMHSYRVTCPSSSVLRLWVSIHGL